MVKVMPFVPVQLMVLGGVDVTAVPWQFEEAATSYDTTVLLAGTVALHVPVLSVTQVTAGVIGTTVLVPGTLKVNVICSNHIKSRSSTAASWSASQAGASQSKSGSSI